MEILIGLLIIAIGSFCQSSSYVPIKKVKEWSWESFWLIQGVFAWLVFPFLGSLLGVPQESSLFDLWGAGGAGMSIFYGILWGWARRSRDVLLAARVRKVRAPEGGMPANGRAE